MQACSVYSDMCHYTLAENFPVLLSKLISIAAYMHVCMQMH